MLFTTKLKKFRSSYFIIVPKKWVDDNDLVEGVKLKVNVDVSLSTNIENLEVHCRRCSHSYIIEEGENKMCPNCGNDKEKHLETIKIVDYNEIPFKEDLVEYRCSVCTHQFILNKDEEPYCPSCDSSGSCIEIVDSTLVSAKEVNNLNNYKGG